MHDFLSMTERDGMSVKSPCTAENAGNIKSDVCLLLGLAILSILGIC